VRFATPKKGWAVGHFGIVLHTEDGGETWIKQLDGKQAAHLVLDQAQARVQRGEGNAETLTHELNAARQLVEDGPDKPFFDVYFENETTGFVVGAYNLIFNKYYVDELYDLLFARPTVALSNWLWRSVDAEVIDGVINGTANTVGANSGLWRRLQTGNVQHYAISMLLGAVAILGYYALR
jgi:hypothetical protein